MDEPNKIMSKKLFFDTGPIITLIMSRLGWILPELKKKYGGKFYLTPAVKLELITRPMEIKRFEFEALQTMKLIKEGILEVYEEVPRKKASELINLANNSFMIDNKAIDIIQSGEIESIVSALEEKAEAVVMDERTLRLFIENSLEMKKLLEMRFRKKVTVNKENMEKFAWSLSKIKIIRSIELVSVAYKLGLLDSYVPPGKKGKEDLIDAVLWATKYNGCAVTEPEIEEIKTFLLTGK